MVINNFFFGGGGVNKVHSGLCDNGESIKKKKRNKIGVTNADE